ncbi:MAG: helix-turn-helix domain-containing protein [Polyangiales bacterium]
MRDSAVHESLSEVHSRLGSMLKSDIAIEPLAPLPANATFRSFSSRAISVMTVQGGAIDLRKRASQTQDVHLLRVLRGSAELGYADGVAKLEAGQFLAFRGAQALQFRHEHSIELLAVFLPRRRLERWLPEWQAAEFVPVSDRPAEGRLSFDIARDLLEHSDQLQDQDSAEWVGDSVARLFARALASASLASAAAPEDLAEANRRKVRGFCRRYLASAELSVEMVARGTGLSRAALHRLFSGQPHTLMQWVQLERLEACRQVLVVAPAPLSTLTEVALAHGFKNPAHFSTAFRRRYGASPREYRALLVAGRTDKPRDAQ